MPCRAPSTACSAGSPRPTRWPSPGRTCPGRTSPGRRCGPSSPRWTGRPRAGPRSRAALGLPPDRQTVAVRRRLARRAAGQPGRGRAGRRPGPRCDGPLALPRHRAAGLRGVRDRAEAAADRTATTARLCATGSCPSRTGCPTSTTRPTSASSRAGAMTVAELLVAGVPGHPRPAARAPRVTTRRATPRRWSAWARRCSSPIRVRRAAAGRGARCAPGRPRPPAGHGRGGPGPRPPRRGRPCRRAGRRPCPLTPARRRWSRGTPLDLRAPRRIHIVGHRRGRHERHRARAAGHGSPRLGLGPEGLAGGGAPALPRHHGGGRAPAGERGRRRRGHLLARRCQPENPELRRGARPGHPRSCPAPRCWPPSAPPAAAWPSSGTHGKTTTASMLSLILVEAGLRPSFVIGADVNEIGTNAVWDTGEWLVVEADESYGTFQAIRAGPGRAHQRRAGPPRLLRHLRRAAARLRRLRGAAPRRARSSAPTTPRRRPSAGSTGRSPSGPTAGATYVDGATSTCSAARCPSPCAGPTGELGTAAHRRPGPAQRAERRGRRRGGARRPGRPSRRPRPRWPASPGSPGASSSAARPPG